MLLGNKSYAVWKPVYFSFKWWHICKERAFVWALILRFWYPQVLKIRRHDCPEHVEGCYIQQWLLGDLDRRVKVWKHLLVETVWWSEAASFPSLEKKRFNTMRHGDKVLGALVIICSSVWDQTILQDDNAHPHRTRFIRVHQRRPPECGSGEEGLICQQSWLRPHGTLEVSLGLLFVPEGTMQPCWLTCNKCWFCIIPRMCLISYIN